ncbi:hypothetical protein [Streptomyces sp. NPDC096324]|uniref:hypothetical protein n=1 Tax=Streptomyces sp. NPDC096324 TaxID=3366085 RepID=UPI003815BDBD
MGQLVGVDSDNRLWSTIQPVAPLGPGRAGGDILTDHAVACTTVDGRLHAIIGGNAKAHRIGGLLLG